MKNNMEFRAMVSGVCALLFVVLMMLVSLADVQAIGPQGSVIGLAGLNGAAKDLLGYHPVVYVLSELLGFGALLTPVLFGCLGFLQLLQRRDLRQVDIDLYFLAATYVLMAALYIFFEKCVINYRPVLIGGELEASFPSSHTMLSITLLGTAADQFRSRISNPAIERLVVRGCYVLMTAIVLTRLLSGVHWLTDILAGALLGIMLVQLYKALNLSHYEGAH